MAVIFYDIQYCFWYSHGCCVLKWFNQNTLTQYPNKPSKVSAYATDYIKFRRCVYSAYKIGLQFNIILWQFSSQQALMIGTSIYAYTYYVRLRIQYYYGLPPVIAYIIILPVQQLG